MTMYPARWFDDVPLLAIDLGTSTLGRIVERVRSEDPYWVVLRRGPDLSYAFRAHELLDLAQNRRFAKWLPASLAFGLRRDYASGSISLQDRPWELPYVPGAALPSVGRVVVYDESGEPAGVGEPALESSAIDEDGEIGPVVAEPDEWAVEEAEGIDESGAHVDAEFEEHVEANGEPEPPFEPSDLGAPRNGDPDRVETPAAEPQETVPAVLSAQAPAQIVIGQESTVDVRAELAVGARPLARAVSTTINTQEGLSAILTGFDLSRLAAEDRVIRLPPPKAGEPSVSAFVVRGLEAGPTDLTVLFRQGGTDLAQISFALDVVSVRTGDETLEGVAEADARDPGDDRVVTLLIDEERVGDAIRFRCIVTSDMLGLENAEYHSDLVEARAGVAASASLLYVQSIYRRITERVLVNENDVRVFGRELKAIGADLCRQLFSRELARLLWDRRSEIELVKITSREPYIPWELLRLKHPDSDETDERFLSEYGLVRSLSGRSFPKTLKGKSWHYLAGDYPNLSRAAVGGELDYIVQSLPGRYGLTPKQVVADAETVLDALAKPEFDVLHIACHGRSELDDIERTELIIADRKLPDGTIGDVLVSAVTVREEAKLLDRTPLVFVNACETAQQAPSLTDWGGWPQAFFQAGAGAYVGTSWSVHEKPAAAFAEAFYESLLAGQPFADAMMAARRVGKDFGDASWLAFVAYGQPNARLER